MELVVGTMELVVGAPDAYVHKRQSKGDLSQYIHQSKLAFKAYLP